MQGTHTTVEIIWNSGIIPVTLSVEGSEEAKKRNRRSFSHNPQESSRGNALKISFGSYGGRAEMNDEALGRGSLLRKTDERDGIPKKTGTSLRGERPDRVNLTKSNGSVGLPGGN